MHYGGRLVEEKTRLRKIDYAKMAHRECWLRHPVFGDPSFDNFTKLGETVHRSEPPFEWAVNGSIFSDPKTGYWYYYAAQYPYDYSTPNDNIFHFIIYRSKDKGITWENLGKGFEDFSCPFPGLEEVLMGHPDVILTYDEESDKYWLTYDWVTGVFRWDGNGKRYLEECPDHGVAMAWADRPEGPFHKLNTYVHNNRYESAHLGRFNRGYASSTIKRKNDWICFILQDSGPYYGWALSCRTAKTPDGEWSKPRVILSPDRQEYYPELLEFCFCMNFDGTVYAPATSVAGNRNYQVIFAADLEYAEYPSAWKMVREGSVWHSRPLKDETYGIWGQTLQGFIEDDKVYTMYVGLDDRKYGTLSMASCPLNKLYTDGFTISGHSGKSISPILAAYDDFRLKMEMEYTGTIEVFLKYNGILGPNKPESNAVTSEDSFVDSLSVELSDRKEYRVLFRDKKGAIQVLHRGTTAGKAVSLEVIWEDGHMELCLNQEKVWESDLASILYGRDCMEDSLCVSPVAICTHELTVLDCSCFKVEGIPQRYHLRYSAIEAVLSAMQHNSWTMEQDERFITQKGYVGKGTQSVKWNFRGDSFKLYAPKGPNLGRAEIWVDGFFYGTADLYAETPLPSEVVYEIEGLPGDSRHCVTMKGFEGQGFAVDILEVSGEPA